MPYKNYNQIFGKVEDFTFEWGYDSEGKEIEYTLPARISFALEMQIVELLQDIQSKGNDADVEDIKRLYSLLLGDDTFNALWNSGISKELLEKILADWQEYRSTLVKDKESSPKVQRAKNSR